jgi:hypothetical protein
MSYARAMKWVLLASLIGCGDDLHPKSIDARADSPPNTSCAACNPATEYCYQIFAGVQPTLGCNALPAACVAAPTCACVTADIDPCGGALSCTQDANGIAVACNKI